MFQFFLSGLGGVEYKDVEVTAVRSRTCFDCSSVTAAALFETVPSAGPMLTCLSTGASGPLFTVTSSSGPLFVHSVER